MTGDSDVGRCGSAESEGRTLTNDDGVVLEMSWLLFLLLGRHRMGAVLGREGVEVGVVRARHGLRLRSLCQQVPVSPGLADLRISICSYSRIRNLRALHSRTPSTTLAPACITQPLPLTIIAARAARLSYPLWKPRLSR